VAGLRREIMEETGLEVSVLGIAHVWFGSVDGVQSPLLCINFVAESSIPDVRLSAEHAEFVWVTQQQISSGEILTLNAEGYGYQPKDILNAFKMHEILRRTGFTTA
jgi:8-oxo-dGTP pyrophosphatase MutT (NUDIX family)